jgi:predicted dehydrogenase
MNIRLPPQGPIAYKGENGVSKLVRIAVAGAGLIGKRHIEAVMAAPGAVLAAIVDPTDTARAFAAERGAPWFGSLGDMIAANASDGVIIATPNQMHVDNGLECVAAGLPLLVEKPIATDVAAAEKLIAAAEAANVPVLVGHHRRHNQLIQRARAEIESGAIGEIVSVTGITWFFKPDEYFDIEWRRTPGAGPVYLNLIHDIDVMHYLCGPIETVHAVDSNAMRNNVVEDTAIILLKFKSGALGTFSVSDTIVAPWSWELTARENPAYPPTAQPTYFVGGTHGSLELPGLRLWRYREKRSWWEPIDATQLAFDFADPLICQVNQFAAVIRSEEAPLASGRDGLSALRVVEAVKLSARTGETVKLHDY